MHKVFENFYINDTFCPKYNRMNARLLLEYKTDGKGFTTKLPAIVFAQPVAVQEPQELEESKEPASNNLPAHQVPQGVNPQGVTPEGVTPREVVTAEDF